MKKSYFLFLSLILAGPTVFAQWTNLGSPGFSPGGLSNWQDIEIDSNNTVYVSFNDEGLPAGQGTVMKYTGSQWTAIGNAGFTPGIAHHSAFCLGLGDTVYFSFADGNNMSIGAVMRYDGTAWTSIGSNISVGELQYSDIEIASDGTPYVAFIDNGIGGTVTVLKYDGSAWVPLGGTATISAPGSSFSSMAINSSDEVYVAFQDGAAMDSVTVKKFDGANWVNVGTSFLSNQYAGSYDVCLDFDHNDVPYVAYWNPMVMGPKASVNKFDGTNWTFVGPPSFTTGVTLFTELAFDTANVPYITFHDQTLGTKASVMNFDGTNWNYLGAPGFTPDVAAHTAMAIDGDNNPYVVYYDASNSGKTSVMIYCEAPTVASISADTTICSGDSLVLMVDGDLNDATEWYWYAGSCGGTPVDSGSSITVAPGATTTYYVRGEGFCVTSGPCTDVAVTVMPMPATPTITVNGLTLTSSAASGNQWYLDGNLLGGANAQTYNATASGWYQVEVSNGTCSAISDSVHIDTCDAPSIPFVISDKDNFCPGETATLSHNGTLNDAVQWYWYSGSCGGSLVDTGATLTISPAVSTTYYVRGEGNCVSTGACGSLLLNVLPAPAVPTITVNGFTLTSSATTDNQWYLDGNIIPGATSQTYVASATGTYTVAVGSECKTFSLGVHLDPLGLVEISAEAIALFPQPFKDLLQIKLEGNTSPVTLKVYDSIGKLVLDIHGISSHRSINVSHLAPGIYLAEISSGKGKKIFRKLTKN